MTSMTFKERRIGALPAIAVSECGQGELLMFLHGIGGNSSNWSEQLQIFGEGYLAVAWDARGYSRSDDYAGAVSFDVFADDVLRVLDHYGAKAAHLCGLSLGGRIAQRFYARYPDRVASLILADTRPDAVDTRSQADRDAFLASRAKPLLEGRTPADIAPAVARGLAGPNVRPEVLQRLIDSISALRTESYLKTIKANLDDDYAGGALAAIAVPTLVIVGEHDTLTSPAIAKMMAAAIPGAELAVIPDSGHLTNLEQPERFNAVLAGFLDRVSALRR